MPRSAIVPPTTDPTPIFEHFRGSYGTELLTAAVGHLDLFGALESPKSFEEIRAALGLDERPTVVLLTAMRAMRLVARDEAGKYLATDLAKEHLVTGADFDVSGYLGLAAQAPGVLEMVERLRTNRPAGSREQEDGAAFIYREGIESAMERESSARSLTLALAGRAKNVAPHVARVAPLEGASRLLDVGGGTGIYAIACLQAHPGLRAQVWDRPEVLKVAREMAEAHGVEDRLELVPGDMFADPVPAGADAILLSNILHDWDVPECRTLVHRLAGELRTGGRLMIHDVFLNDDLDGPLPIALYSAALFTLTEGRAYSAAEYRGWLEEAGLEVGPMTPTLIHCGVLAGTKPE
jgi:ubiquinone/menaquinone biosynthesis C-methylase UbiE